jgi:meso-butanediol dehydrogenase/(S,S)-butanediol dehydrogenase/diacetyl reductase
VRGLDGVSIVVTGAAQGLGRGLALSLGGRGARIAAVDVDGKGVQRTVKELIESGASAVGYELDVTSVTQAAAVFSLCSEQLNGIDLLVNNAGVLTYAPVLQLQMRDWRNVMEVNATGVFVCSQAVARLMVQQSRQGSIISIASVAGKEGEPGLAHYCASKFAVIGFTQALAKELAIHGITVNAICPGTVMTAMIGQLAAESGTDPEDSVKRQLIERPQTPEEVALAIEFVHACRSITGQAINVDGGTVFH